MEFLYVKDCRLDVLGRNYFSAVVYLSRSFLICRQIFPRGSTFHPYFRFALRLSSTAQPSIPAITSDARLVPLPANLSGVRAIYFILAERCHQTQRRGAAFYGRLLWRPTIIRAFDV